MRAVDGVSALVDDYDAFLLDQFGVLHDGREPYAHAVEASRRLHEAGKQILVLSNSGRRAEATLNKLIRMGYERHWFTGAGCVTSGETTWRALEDRNAFPRAWRSCLHINWGERGEIKLDGGQLGISFVTSVEEADFVLASGMETLTVEGGPNVAFSLDELRSLLEKAAQRGLDLVIANPDVATVDADCLTPMPGVLGQWYSEMSGHGQIHLMGKPDACIYAAARRLLISPGVRVLAVGDSLAHDVAGAHAAGIDSLFITSGIHREQCGGPDDAAHIQRLIGGGAMPTYAARDFCW